jgi:hypothetical protein
MLMTNLIDRFNTLLDRPQAFLLYQGGEGGEFMSSLITQYSSVYNNPTNTQYDSVLNRTIVNYPNLYSSIFNTIPASIVSRSEIIDFLIEQGKITEESISEAEQYFDTCSIPLFRAHHLQLELLTQRSYTEKKTWVLFAPIQWRQYTRALLCVKNKGKLKQFLFILNSKSIPTREQKIIRLVEEYMSENSITDTHIIRLEVLLKQHSMSVPSIEWVFEQPISEIYQRYKNVTFPIKHYHPGVNRTINTHRANPLFYQQIFQDPEYMAREFMIVDKKEEFYRRLLDWHHANLDLLNRENITDFESLRISQ